MPRLSRLLGSERAVRYLSKTLRETIMQAIITKRLSATNTKGVRIKATTGSGHDSVTVSYDYKIMSEEDMHWKAASALLLKIEWARTIPYWHGGWTTSGMVWVGSNEGAYRVLVEGAT
jgi:hypothetical protein